jgi:hypothetical protein
VVDGGSTLVTVTGPDFDAHRASCRRLLAASRLRRSGDCSMPPVGPPVLAMGPTVRRQRRSEGHGGIETPDPCCSAGRAGRTPAPLTPESSTPKTGGHPSPLRLRSWATPWRPLDLWFPLIPTPQGPMRSVGHCSEHEHPPTVDHLSWRNGNHRHGPKVWLGGVTTTLSEPVGGPFSRMCCLIK